MAEWTAERLIGFRNRVVDAFRNKKIRAPVHFPGGDERQLIEAMVGIRHDDWLCLGWRSMYAALIKGCSEEWVFDEILAGRSMYLCSRENRVVSSSIVGGILPIACGLALAIKRSGGSERVWIVVGDMTESIGLYHEFVKYCTGHALPVKIIVSDNGFSTNAVTRGTWGTANLSPEIIRYQYHRSMPHVGLLERVSF